MKASQCLDGAGIPGSCTRERHNQLTITMPYAMYGMAQVAAKRGVCMGKSFVLPFQIDFLKYLVHGSGASDLTGVRNDCSGVFTRPIH